MNKFLNNYLDFSLYFDNISSINIENIKNLNITLSKYNNNTQLNVGNSDFENIN